MENVVKIKFYPEGEILGMSGPWAGKVEINQYLLEGEFLDQPFIFNESKEYLLLVKYEKAKMLKDVKFIMILVNCYNLNTYKYIQPFDKLYIESFYDSSIVYFNSFNNENQSKKSVIKFNDIDFIKE